MAAQISSVVAVITSSTWSRRMRKVSLPIWRTATPSANRPTSERVTRRLRSMAACRQAASSGSTAMIFTSGRTYFT